VPTKFSDYIGCGFYARQPYRQVLLRARISYGNSAEPVEIGQDNLRMKCSALNVVFNSARLDSLGSRSPPY